MSGRRWIALVVLVAIGIGLLVAIVAMPWDDNGGARLTRFVELPAHRAPSS